LQSCLTPFLHADKQGKKLFTFAARVRTPGPMPSALEEEPSTGLVCSPGSRIIYPGASEDGPSNPVIMDGRLSEFVFGDLATDLSLSPDRRFMIYRPWGGPAGKSSVIGGQTLYLVDIDQSLKPNGKEILSIVNVYPTDADAFHSPADSKNEGAAFDTWYDRFETLPQADKDIAWTGSRQFTFSLAADDSQDDVHTRPSGKSFQVTATIVLAGSQAPKVVLSIPQSRSCPSGVAAIHAVVDAVTACSK